MKSGFIVWQIIGMIGAEVRLHWRRRAFPVLTLAMLALPLAIALIIRGSMDELTRGLSAVSGDAAAVAAHQVTLGIVYFTWAPVYIVLTLMLPPVLAESIPRDRQEGVSELLDSLPLTPGTYLLGKLLGAWLTVLISFAATALIATVVWLVAVGVFEPLPYLEMWLVGAMGLACANGGLAVLLAAGQPTRRRAVLVGAALSIITLFVLTPSLQAEPGSLLYLLSPARPALFGYYLVGWTTSSTGSPFQTLASSADVWQGLLTAAATLAVVGIGIWLWLLRRARS
jgi:ABC-type transport system involved in multi-copper enzyme maturation permease subunit